MRWPLRLQILWPMAGVMVVTVSLVSGVSAFFAANRVERQIEKQLRDVVSTLSRSSFPLTDAVLQQMRGLVGADFVLTDSTGRTVAASRTSAARIQLPIEPTTQRTDDVRLIRTVRLAEGRCFHVGVRIQSRGEADHHAVLHILYPEESYQEAFRDAVYPPLAVGIGALVLM
jgi:hypothetical protein